MHVLWDSGVRSRDKLLLPRSAPGETVDAGYQDRSLAAVMREIAQTLAGWLFFVVAVELLLRGTQLVGS